MCPLCLLAILLATAASQSCPPKDLVRFADSQQCDKYVECREGSASEQLCPDGLLFNELSSHPCVYPNEVDCGSRTKTQAAKPSANCAHAWGHYSSGDNSQCGTFWTCVDNREFLFSCPEGLAFSSSTYRCEWPDESPDCDAAAFLGFSCPAQPDLEQVALFGHPRYRSPRSCHQFFHCVLSGHTSIYSPRLQTCELGKVFNEVTHDCDDQENVPGCENTYLPEELQVIRAQKERSIMAEQKRQEERQKLKANLANRFK